jgi:hypothetical protein
MRKFYGTVYSQYDALGNDSPLWKWASMAEMLSAFLQDSTQSDVDKKYAATILRFSVERAKTIDPEVAKFLDALDLSMLWGHPENWAIKDVTDQKGKTTRQVVFVGSSFTPVKAAPTQTSPVSVDESEEI